LSYGTCCTAKDSRRLEKCMQKHKFCTAHLTHSIYKVFTCPMQGCEKKSYTVTDYNKVT